MNQQVQAAMQNLNIIQEQIDNIGFKEELSNREKEAQIALEKALHFEEAFWQQKAGVDWHLKGD